MPRHDALVYESVRGAIKVPEHAFSCERKGTNRTTNTHPKTASARSKPIATHTKYFSQTHPQSLLPSMIFLLTNKYNIRHKHFIAYLQGS